MKKALTLLIALIAVGCSYANTGPDEFACAYGGGLFESQTLKAEFEPGSGRDFVGVADTIIELPANIRNYIIDKDPGTGDLPTVDSIIAPAGDGVNIELEIQSRFRYNTKLGCQFWDETGKRFDVDTDEGWRDFLEQNFRPIFENATKSEVQSQPDWENIWRNRKQDGVPTWSMMQDNIGSAMVKEINRSLGDDYFCGVTWTSGSTSCPPFEILIKSAVSTKGSLMDRYTNIQDENAAEELQEAELQKEKRRLELVAENDLVRENARIERELNIAEGEIEVARLELEQARLDGESAAVECVELAKAGVDCTLLAAAKNGSIDFWVIDPDAQGQSTPLITREVG